MCANYFSQTNCKQLGNLCGLHAVYYYRVLVTTISLRLQILSMPFLMCTMFIYLNSTSINGRRGTLLSCHDEHMSTVGRQKCRSDPSRLNPVKSWSFRIEPGNVNKKLLSFLLRALLNTDQSAALTKFRLRTRPQTVNHCSEYRMKARFRLSRP